MVFVTINQTFFLFCCTEEYNINASQGCSLSSKSNYFLRYTFPDGTTKDASAQLSSTNVLTSQSPDHDHSCTVHVRLYTTGEHAETLTEFSLELVSPVEYLFRKFSANEFEMPDEISNKMTSALLAMSLSYYYVMGEHVEKEIRRTDEILSTLLQWSTDNSYINITEERKTNSTEETIGQFARHYKLRNTLQYLSGENGVEELPVQLPKSLVPQNKPPRRPAIIPRTRSKTLPSAVSRQESTTSQSEYSPLQPVESDPQEGYMYMENQDKYELDNMPDNNDDDEEYYLVDQPDNASESKQPSKNGQPKITTRSKSLSSSSSSTQFSPPAVIPRLPIEDFIPDEVYELCDLTPAEVAAVALLKKRGPPPKPPPAYRASHATDKDAGYGVLRPGELNKYFKSSLESSLKSSLAWLSLNESGSKPPPLGPKPPSLGPKPSTFESKPALGPKPSVKQKPPIRSPKPVRELKAPPRKKHNIVHKTKAEQAT